MGVVIRKVDYFYTTIAERPGGACGLLRQLAEAEVNLLAFNAVPIGPENTQLVLFPERVDLLLRVAEKEGFSLTGPQSAFLIQGDDRLGVLAEIHQRLCDSNVSVFASSGVTDGRGGYGYIVYVKPEDYETAETVLEAV